jgi:hypothetical protein
VHARSNAPAGTGTDRRRWRGEDDEEGVMVRKEETTPPRNDDTRKVQKLHGLDRGSLGEKGWAEVPDDLIGGHPELETAPKPDQSGGLNGPQPETDLTTGAVKPDNDQRKN